MSKGNYSVICLIIDLSFGAHVSLELLVVLCALSFRASSCELDAFGRCAMCDVLRRVKAGTIGRSLPRDQSVRSERMEILGLPKQAGRGERAGEGERVKRLRC